MAVVNLQNLTGAVFRTNPRYKLVPFDRLPVDQQEALASVRQNSDLFGVLVPVEKGNLTFKSVCHKTASLFSALAEPGEIPNRFKSESDREFNQVFAELVLDEVLEIASAGDFVSGAAAYPVIFRDQVGREGAGRLARISLEALRYAAALEINDAVKLSARIYFYNRIPVTPYWKRRWPDAETVLRCLRDTGEGAYHAVFANNFTLAPTSRPYTGWLTWADRARIPSRPMNKVVYKLYVSPLPTHVEEAFAAIITTLAHGWCFRFKVGCDAHGLLRPDKIVCYFENFDDLKQFAIALEPKITGFPVHGVPFSAPMTYGGLLSWGIDPPRDEARLQWMESESWRLWVTNRLANALIAARDKADNAIEPWRFAMERLRLAGVDTETWTPNESTWLTTGVSKNW